MAVDMFLKLDGIKGESLDRRHAGEIEILSYSWGMSQTSVGSGGAGSGKVSVHDISITKVTDSATPQMMMSCVKGSHIATGQISVRKAGEKPLEYLKIKLTDILISSVQMDGHGAGTPADMFTLDFKKAEFDIASPIRGGIPQVAVVVNSEQGQVVTPPA